MRIAQIAPLHEAVPPRLYGGTERVVAHLTDALVDLGHEVTLFASAEARTKAALVPARDRAIRLDPAPLKSDLAAHLALLHEVHRRRHDFDLLHFHLDLLHFPFFADLAARTVTTLHGRLDLEDLPAAYARWPRFPLVSVSDAQRAPLPGANWMATVHHGLPAGLLPFSETPRSPALYSSAGSARRSGWTGRSPSPSAPACACGSPPRSTPSTAPTSRKRSRPCCATSRWSSSWARSGTRRRRRSSAAPARCCSRSTGRSRSGW
jgi:hypothetical protein